MQTQMEVIKKLPPDQKNNTTIYSWDIIQQNLKCCGIYNYTDWSEMVPDSCCKKIGGKNCVNIAEEQNEEENITERIHITGCFDQIENKFQNTVFTAIGCIIGIILLIIVGIVLGLKKLENISKDLATIPQDPVITYLIKASDHLQVNKDTLEKTKRNYP